MMGISGGKPLPSLHASSLENLAPDLTTGRDLAHGFCPVENPYAAAFAHAATGMALLALDGNFLRVNQAYCDWLGYTEAELGVLGFTGITHPQDQIRQQQELDALQTGIRLEGRLELRCHHKLGNELWGLMSIALVHGPAGRPLYFVVQIQDITARKSSEARLGMHEQELAEILARIPDVITRFSRTLRILYVNPSIQTMLGLPSTHFLGRTLEEAGLEPEFVRQHEAQLREVFQSGEGGSYEHQMLPGPRYLQVHLLPERDHTGRIITVLAITRDITQLRQTQLQFEQAQTNLLATNAELEGRNQIDDLTGLPNKRAFEEKLAEEQSLALQNQIPFCVMLMETDQFTEFQEAYGAAEVERALRQVGHILRRALGKDSFLARYGSEEFAIILPHTEKPDGIQAAERCREALNDFFWPRRPITGSFGIAHWRGQDIEEIQLQAEAALYTAKNRGGDRAIHVDELFNR